MGDAPDVALPVDPAYGEILPPEVLSRLNASAARTLIGRLVRGGDISPELLTLVDGPLADAVSRAADYAGKSIAPGTVATYKGDWSDFARWARANGVDPTVLPIHPVVVAAWLLDALGHGVLRQCACKPVTIPGIWKVSTLRSRHDRSVRNRSGARAPRLHPRIGAPEHRSQAAGRGVAGSGFRTDGARHAAHTPHPGRRHGAR